MDQQLIDQLNKVPDVFGFSGKGHERLFSRKTEPQQTSAKKAAQGRIRRQIEELNEMRQIEKDFDYI